MMNLALLILHCMLYTFGYPNLIFFSDSLPALVLNLKILHKFLQPPGLEIFFSHFETDPYVFIPYT